MAKEQQNVNTKRDAESYLRMGNLLKKRRPPVAEAQVHDILSRQISITDKISFIEEVDKGSSQDQASQATTTPPKPDSTSSDAPGFEIHIKKVIERNGLLAYLFRDFTRIRRFAKKSGLLKASFLPPRVRLKTAIRKNLLLNLQKQAAQLLPALDAGLEYGWRMLHKLEYNLLARLHVLCLLLLACDPLQENEKQFLIRFRKLEEQFLKCHYRQDYPDKTVSALLDALEQSGEDGKDQEFAAYLAREILSRYGNPLSLRNLVLAANMVSYRRFLNLQDLLGEHHSGAVQSMDFNCSPAVRKRINRYIRERENALQSQLKERSEINQMKKFLDQLLGEGSGGNSNFDHSVLEQFYEQSDGGLNFHFNDDVGNLPLLAYNLLESFTSAFDDLLNDRVKLEEEGGVPIFSSDFFHMESGQLHLLIRKFSKLSFVRPVFGFNDFVSLQGSGDFKGVAQGEIFIVQAVVELSKTMVDLGTKVGQICLRHNPDVEPETGRSLLNPLDPSALYRDSFAVPHWDKYISGTGYLRGRSVGEALQNCAAVCFSIAFFLRDPQLSSLGEREHKIEVEIRKIRNDLERICSPLRFETLIKKYGL